MPTELADRNLLFGVLALQMDFITRDDLVLGMNAWILDKTKPLGRILRDQGVVRADAHELLEALVAKHVEIHGNDTQESLKAISSIRTTTQVLESIQDADVEATISALGRSRFGQDESAYDRTPKALENGRRFQVVRTHAKGGLGEVYLAEDLELHRQVAFKEIRRDHAHDSFSRERFVLEAEITGGLEHPGVVPVYSLGAHPDGRPYYAMRFVKGDNLREAIERFHATEWAAPAQENLAFRQLLRRFVDICNTIAYAHSRGVLHRDIKPGNVMLGQYGETLVVDWGLAKAMGRRDVKASSNSDEATFMPRSASGSQATLDGSVLGTPAFMSPEQAAGKLDELGPASDVYSLGAILYTLLVGKPPFQSDTGDTLKKVKAGSYEPPRALKPMVCRALEAVSLKAMALDPLNRYAHANELASDVEKWLADEPVSTYHEPLTVAGQRWLRRHRTLATSAVVATFVALAALLVVVYLNIRLARAEAGLSRQAALRAVEEKSKADAARDSAKRSEAKTLSEKRNADVARLAAETAKTKAQQEVEDALTRNKVVSERLASTRAKLFELDAESARLRSALGFAADSLSSRSYFGEYRAGDSSEYLKKAAEAFENVALQKGDSQVAQATRADGEFLLSAVLWSSGKTSEAQKTYESALASQSKLATDYPNNPRHSNRLAAARLSLAKAALGRGALGEAREQLEQARQQHLAALKADPQFPSDQLFLRNYHRLGAEIGIATAEHIEAIQHAREFSKHAYVSEQDLYDAGRLMVRCAKLVNVNRRDLHPTVLEADRVATYESYLADAAKTLELALDRGGLDAWRLQSDADLQPLRESRYFQQLRERFRVLREGVFWDSVEYPF